MKPLSLVLCAYGPTKTTRHALRRLRPHLSPRDEIYVYPGTTAGRVANLTMDGVTVVDRVGRDGLLKILAECSGDFVLHVTDGVTLPPRSLARLRDAAAETGKLVVPWSNDIGTDHYVGPLRVQGSDLLRELSDVARRQHEGRTAGTVRPTCIGGTVAQLRGLIPFHISYPSTLLRLVGEDCIVVGGAVAAHDGSGERRLLRPVGPDGRPLLVASMIVRDEEAFLADCLASLAGLVDRIDILDTGSVDRTVEIAMAAGARVQRGEWRDDFAWARNRALEMSEDAWWVLWIDADERAVCPDPVRLRRELATAIGHFDSLGLAITNPEESGLSGSHWVAPRVLAPATMHFEGPLHEQIVARDPSGMTATTTLEGLVLEHYGYSHEIVEGRDKATRNLGISRTTFEQRPDDPQAALQYARSLSLAGRPAEERLEPLQIAHDGFEHGGPRLRALVKGLLAEAKAQTGSPEEAMELAREALELVPADDIAMNVLLGAAQKLDQVRSVLPELERYSVGSSLRPLYQEPGLRAKNRAFRVQALLEDGDLDGALGFLRLLAAEGAQSLPVWPELIDALLSAYSPERLIELLSEIVTLWGGGDWALPLAKRLRHDLVVDLVELCCASGTPSGEALRVGMTLATLRKDWAALQRLSEYADVMPTGDRRALANRLQELGRPELASLISADGAEPTEEFIL